MKVTFDGFWWDQGPISNQTVLRELIHTWNKEFPEDQIEVVIPFAQHPVSSTLNIKKVIFPKIYHPIFNLLFVSFSAWRSGADCVIFQNFAGKNKNTSVFIHDFIFLDHPEWFEFKERIYFSLMKPMAQIFSKRIFTSSFAEKQRISRYIANREVGVARLGVRRELRKVSPNRPEQLGSFAGPFIFTSGRNNPRKNLAFTISSYLEATKIIKLPKLVVLGVSKNNYKMTEEADEIHESVIFLNKVSDGELSWLYQNCVRFVFLSLDEGFGLPVLEAGYFGASLLLSNISVFREVSMRDAIFVNPQSPDELKRELMNYDYGLRKDKKISHDLESSFDWKQMVLAMRPYTSGVH